MRLALLAMVLACGCGQGGRKTSAAARPPASTDQTAAVLAELSILARAAPPSAGELEDWSGRLARGQATLSDYVDLLLASPAFSRTIAPGLILGDVLHGWTPHVYRYVLQATTDDGPAVYHLRKPCRARDAVRVSPWWDLKTEVLVCPDSYRPDVWRARAAGGDYACNAVDAGLAADSPCGCGPNLFRCQRDRAEAEAAVKSAHAELRDTVTHVVEHDLPYARLFTGRATFHDRRMEHVYRSWRIEEEHQDARQLADLAAWPAGGKWAERFEVRPGMHAGILTSPGILHFLPDRRQRQWVIFERLWCAGGSSVGALPEDLLGLGGVDFQADRNDGWKELAARPICTGCHARTDYGFQFFWAFPDPRLTAGHFVAELARNGTKGILYGRDIRDPRGEAELTPAGFARIALEQPEFGRCMAQNMAEHVFGNDMSRDDVRALAAGFDGSRVTIKQLAKATLLRYADRAQESSQAGALHDAPAWTGSGPIAISRELKDATDANCARCHFDGAERLPSFDGGALSRELLVRMLASVAAERMPPNTTLRTERRLELVDLLAAHIWRSPSDREEVRHNLGGTALRPGVWRWSLAQHLIRRSAGAPESSDRPWNALEMVIRADRATYTPGFAAMSAIEAVDACTQAGKQEGADLERCVREATRPQRFLRR